MNKTKSGLVILGLMAAALAAPAAAQEGNDDGVYIGGSYGRVWYKHSCDNQPIPCGDVDPAWRAFAGYRFNPNWALELGYADLGAAKGSGVTAGGLAGSTERTVYSFDASLVATFRIQGGLHGLARLGAYRARSELESDIGGVVTKESKTNSAWMGGLGLEYQLWRMGIRAEWIHWLNVGDASTGGRDDLDALLIGLTFRF